MNKTAKKRIKKHNKFKTVRIEELIENPENPNNMSNSRFKKLVRNIERTGLYEPIIVRKINTRYSSRNTQYEIINGHSRIKALKQLEYKEVDVCIWNVDDLQTDIYLMTLNHLSGSDILEKKLALLNRISSESDSKQLSEILPFTSGQIERYRNLELPRKPAKHDKNSFAEPVVFFVNNKQKKVIKQAIQKTSSLCKTRSEAITEIAKAFVNTGSDESSR